VPNILVPRFILADVRLSRSQIWLLSPNVKETTARWKRRTAVLFLALGAERGACRDVIVTPSTHTLTYLPSAPQFSPPPVGLRRRKTSSNRLLCAQVT
jgi:hypothetical protein